MGTEDDEEGWRDMVKVGTLLKQTILFLVYGTLGALLAMVATLVLFLESRPDLEPWHRADLKAEFTAATDLESFDQYLELERRLFEQLEEKVYAKTGPAAANELNRYKHGSPSDPARWPRDWNRSFELTHQDPRAIVLLLHGLSDSPYSLRAPGQALHAAGAQVLGLRIPGHGTAPVGLVRTSWHDMAAAVSLAVTDLTQRFPDRPLYLVGYSNGAALALNYTMDALEDADLPRPDRLVLIAPEIAVASAAAFAVWQARLGRLLGLDKLAWNDLIPEYDPFKYGSFPINAADLSYRITTHNGSRFLKLLEAGRLADFPPILAFSSMVDATVKAPQLVARLFNPLPAGGHELVLFDINRQAGVESLLGWRPDEMVSALSQATDNQYRLTVLSNARTGSLEVEAIELSDDGLEKSGRPLGLAWPPTVYSLSHVALSFPETDRLYGGSPEPASPGVSLGNINLRGERGVLQISDSAMLRQRWNPFYPYLERRMLDFLDLD
jgi:alpha-beta hydrolase superfamily lysophospholipase